MTEVWIIPKFEAAEGVHLLHIAKSSMVLGLFLTSDRWSCVDEMTLATDFGYY